MNTFYTVPELARELGITPRAIRLYESKHLLSPQRAGKTRIYTLADKARLELILRGKRLGFSLAQMNNFLALFSVTDNLQSLSQEQLQQNYEHLSQAINELQARHSELSQVLEELNDMQHLWADALNQHSTRQSL